jgi:hypothetical protein
MLLPTLVACTTPQGTAGAGDARLDGIVVDGTRLAQAREPGLAIVIRDGVRQEAYAAMTLHVGDRIETGPRADAVIRYASGTEVLMRPNSGGRIGSLTDVIGEVFVKVKGIFSVDTTFVKAGARGTAYLVRTYAGGTTSVVVIEGIVDVGSTTGAWPTVPIGAGTMTFAHPRAAADARRRRRPDPHPRLGWARRAARAGAVGGAHLSDRRRGRHRRRDRGDLGEPQQGLARARRSGLAQLDSRGRHARHATAASAHTTLLDVSARPREALVAGSDPRRHLCDFQRRALSGLNSPQA